MVMCYLVMAITEKTTVVKSEVFKKADLLVRTSLILIFSKMLFTFKISWKWLLINCNLEHKSQFSLIDIKNRFPRKHKNKCHLIFYLRDILSENNTVFEK